MYSNIYFLQRVENFSSRINLITLTNVALKILQRLATRVNLPLRIYETNVAQHVASFCRGLNRWATKDLDDSGVAEVCGALSDVVGLGPLVPMSN